MMQNKLKSAAVWKNRFCEAKASKRLLCCESTLANRNMQRYTNECSLLTIEQEYA